MPRVLIVGASPVLAGHIAARRLSDADVRLVALAGSASALREFVLNLDTSAAARRRAFEREVADPRGLPDVLADAHADEVWWVALRPRPTAVRAVLRALRGLGATRLVHVGPTGHATLEREVVEGALAAGVAWRVVRVPPVVDERAVALGETPPGPHHLFDAVHSVVAEVTDRLPDYFRDYPLRLPDRGTGLVFARARDVAGQAVAPGEGVHTLALPAPTPLADLLPVISSCYGVTCTAIGPPTDVDRLLALRLDGLATVPVPARGPGPGPWPSHELRELTEGVRKAQDEQLDAARERAARPERWLSTTVVERDADPLTVSRAGEDGPTLVVVNALGQGTGMLTRLLDRLGERHRVVTWRVLGVEPGDRPRDLVGQLDDLADVVAWTGADRVHLVGWCAGAKVAAAFQRRHPGPVASLVFLNATFKQDGRWDDLDVGYERNLDRVVRSVCENPDLAARLIALFSGSGPASGTSPLDVLSPALRDEVLRPFRTSEALVRYARQLRELWAFDTGADAPRVDVDVLFIGADRDTVSSPRRALLAAGLFPRARYAEVALAGHYVPHDRARLVAGLISDFVRDPGTPTADHGEVRWLTTRSEEAG